MEDVQKQEAAVDETTEGPTAAQSSDDGNLIKVEPSSTSKVTRNRVVKEAETPFGNNDAYFIVCGVVIVALVMIIGVVCLCTKCRNHRAALKIAEEVQREERPVVNVKGNFDDLVGFEEPQYDPRAQDTNILGVAPPLSTRGDTAVDTNRELLKEEEVAPVRIQDIRGDN